MKKTSISILSLLLLSVGLSACSAMKNKKNNKEVSTNSLKQECPEALICTMDYRSIGVAVKDINGNAIKLDSVKVYLKENPTVVFSNNLNVFLSDGNYILAEDNAMKHVKKAGSDVVFEGYLTGKLMATHTFSVGHDCCHIKMISKSNEIIVQ